jgi:hypothetical protein
MIAERSARSTVNTPSTRPTDRSAPAGSAQAHEAAPDSTVIGGQQGLKRALNGILIGWDSGEGLDLGAIGRAICLLPSSVGPASWCQHLDDGGRLPLRACEGFCTETG